MHTSEAPSPARTPWFVYAAYLVLFASAAFQLFLIYQIRDYRTKMGCGEPCAFNAMGITVLLYEGAPVIFAGVVATAGLMWHTLTRRRLLGGQLTSLLIPTASFAITLTLAVQVLLSSTPLKEIDVAKKTPPRATGHSIPVSSAGRSQIRLPPGRARVGRRALGAPHPIAATPWLGVVRLQEAP